MSEENVEIVRRVYEAAARRDANAVLACYDPEVEWDVSRSPMARLVGGGVYHGHKGLLSFFRKYHEAWEDIEYEGAELIEAGGEHVISVDTERTRGRTSGVETELTQYAVWSIRNGKVFKVVWFPTREQATEAAGLSE
jgi:ketosteroid isomerase-like protein